MNKKWVRAIVAFLLAAVVASGSVTMASAEDAYQKDTKFSSTPIYEPDDSSPSVNPTIDSDSDGLTDDEEWLYGTNPYNEYDPGIWIKYDYSYTTKDYFCWKRYGDNYITFDSVVLRRGAELRLGVSPAVAMGSMAITPGLNYSLVQYFTYRINPTNPVGKYTIEWRAPYPLGPGDWVKTIDLYLIFEMPAITGEDDRVALTYKGISAYLYDENDVKDDISVLWFDCGEKTYENYTESTFMAGGFLNRQYTKEVFVNHVIPTINGNMTQKEAAEALLSYIGKYKTFSVNNQYFDMITWLTGVSLQGNNASECSAFGGALTSVFRSAGIPARPVIVDYDGGNGDFDTSTEVWLDGKWNVCAATPYKIGCGIKNRFNWYSAGAPNRLIVTAGPDFKIQHLSYGTRWDAANRMIHWKDYQGGLAEDDTIIEYRHYYDKTSYSFDNTGNINRRYWVLTENEIYWNYSEPTDWQVWGNELNDEADWIVSGTESYKDIPMALNGNLTIKSGGNLTFRNVKLMIGCSYDGEHHIEVQSGGFFYIYDSDNSPTASDASIITSNNTNCEYFYLVKPGSRFEMKNSELHECGYDTMEPIQHSALYIETDGVTLENNLMSCNFIGIRLTNSSNNTVIKNGIIANLNIGILLHSSNNNEITKNIIRSNAFTGIHLYNSSENKITYNNVSNNYYGIYLEESEGNEIYHNIVSFNTVNGINLFSCYDDNKIIGNIIRSNGGNGIDIVFSYNNTISSNWLTTSDLIDIYIEQSSNNSVSDNVVRSDAYCGIFLDNSDLNHIFDNDISGLKGTVSGIRYGITLGSEYLGGSSNNEIFNNTIHNNYDTGILFEGKTDSPSKNNIIKYNLLYNNTRDGIRFTHHTLNNRIFNNNISKSDYGISFDSSSNNTITNNSISNNRDGVNFWNSSSNTIAENNISSNTDCGIYFDTSSDNMITGNNIWNNSEGIHLYAVGCTIFECSNNTISDNKIFNNSWGIGLDCVTDNTIYNNYFKNTINAYDTGYDYNIWNITKTSGVNIIGGPYLGGNYWSDYAGTDTDGDGLGDTLLPYDCSGNIQKSGDYLPLVYPGMTLKIPLKFQHKDTNMFCVPCMSNLTHPWNDSLIGCPHCSVYCAPASIAMIAEYYNRNATDIIFTLQDYIYDNGKKLGEIPGDSILQTHGVGMFDISPKEVQNAFRWAICSGTNWTYMEYNSTNPLTGKLIIQYIDNSTPILWCDHDNPEIEGDGWPKDMEYWNDTLRKQGHVKVIAGYKDCGTPTNYADDRYLIYDPWPSANVTHGSNPYWELSTKILDLMDVFLVRVAPPTLPVHNINTSIDYSTIQAAISDPRTLSGHMITVDPGSYAENIVVNKSLTIRSTSGNPFNTYVCPLNSSKDVFCITINNVNISGFTITGATGISKAGIRIYNSSDCNILNNYLMENYYGILLDSSSYNTVTNNTASYNMEDGIHLDSSNYNTIINNIAEWNGMNGICLYVSYNNIVANNKCKYHSISGIFGWLYDGTAYKRGNNSIISNELSNNSYGIYIEWSHYNKIINNTISNSYLDGIHLFECNDNMIHDNIITNSNQSGIFLCGWLERNNSIANNSISKNKNSNGISIIKSYRNQSFNNSIINNSLSNLNVSIYLEGTLNNTISNNTCKKNNYGVYFISSNGNLIYNNYFNNTKNAWDNSINIWNIIKTPGKNIIDGPYLGGNYWSDYAGTDTDGDGLGDTLLPYDCSGNIQKGGDWLPLVKIPQILFFDTGPGTYPSIFGTHNGTISPNKTIAVSRLYTYPCEGTGGHAKYVKIWNSTWSIEASWSGYGADWHNITFPRTFLLKSGETYNYTIETGSYPQIIHNSEFNATGGEITCKEFVDANGRRYDDWIPAIRLY